MEKYVVGREISYRTYEISYVRQIFISISQNRNTGCTVYFEYKYAQENANDKLQQQRQ